MIDKEEQVKHSLEYARKIMSSEMAFKTPTTKKQAKRTVEGMRNVVIANLQRLQVKNEIKSFQVKKIDSTWNTWTFKQKLTWIFKNYLNFGNKEMKEYGRGLKDIYAANSSYEQVEVREYLLEEFKNTNFKYWFEDYPKQVLVCDVNIIPIRPVESITVDINIPKNEEKPDENSN